LNVSFDLFGVLRQIAAQKRVTLDVPDGATVGEAVDRLVDGAGNGLRKFLIAPDGTYTAFFAVGGKRLAAAEHLSPDDVVKVLLASGGG
jgi:hypothetical protein